MENVKSVFLFLFFKNIELITISILVYYFVISRIISEGGKGKIV